MSFSHVTAGPLLNLQMTFPFLRADPLETYQSLIDVYRCGQIISKMLDNARIH